MEEELDRPVHPARAAVKTFLKSVKLRRGKVTPGPYRALKESLKSKLWLAFTMFMICKRGASHVLHWVATSDKKFTAITGNGPNSEANAEFYANAPMDITRLLDIVEVQNKQLDMVRKAINFMAEPGTWCGQLAYELYKNKCQDLQILLMVHDRTLLTIASLEDGFYIPHQESPDEQPQD